MTTIVWDGKTLAADCLRVNESRGTVEQRNMHANKIYLFSDTVWDEDETLHAAAFSGRSCVIDRVVSGIRTQKYTTIIKDYCWMLNDLQLTDIVISQLYITSKAAYLVRHILPYSEKRGEFRKIPHEVYAGPTTGSFKENKNKTLLACGIGYEALQCFWTLTQHELTSEELVFLANGFSFNVGNGINTWRVGDTVVHHRAEFDDAERAAVAEKLRKHTMTITAQNKPMDQNDYVINS